MRAIRYIASVLLLMAGAGHFFMFTQVPRDLVSAVVLAFGVIYTAVGIILFTDVKYSALAGIVFPLTGIIAGLIIFDPAQITPLLGVLGIVEVAIIILCSTLEWNMRRKVV